MKITVLAENTCSTGQFEAEHGLSLFVETEDVSFLFDMGQTDLFAKNATKLGIDLNQAEFAILSHGHYDHGGGLPSFLQLNSHAPVFVNEHAFGNYYNGTEKYIGLDQSLKDHPQLVKTGEVHQIREGMTLFSCNQKEPPFCNLQQGLTVKHGDEFLEDPFWHEQYLLVETKGKRILFSGCSHKGILNVCHWFNPHVLIGGFHFSKRPLDESLRKDGSRLAQYDTEFYTCHCTGYEQYNRMKQEMDRLHYLGTGDCILI